MTQYLTHDDVSPVPLYHQPGSGILYDMKRTLVAIALLPLAACGKDASPPALTDVASKIGCAQLEDGSSEMFTREGGSCTLAGAAVYLYTFADEKNQADWESVAPMGGGILVHGELWTAQVSDSDTAEAIADYGDGEIVN